MQVAAITEVVFLTSGLSDHEGVELLSTVSRLKSRGIDIHVVVGGTVSGIDSVEQTDQLKASLEKAEIETSSSLGIVLKQLNNSRASAAVFATESCYRKLQSSLNGLSCYVLVHDATDAPVRARGDGQTYITKSVQLLQLIPRTHREYNGSLLVGYAFDENRERKLVANGLLRLCDTEGVCFMPLDEKAPFDHQGPVDAVLHKTSGSGDSLTALMSDIAALQDIPVIDKVDAVELVGDRARLCAALGGLSSAKPSGPSGTSVKCVDYKEVASLDDIRVVVEDGSLCLPCLVKGNNGSGGEGAHAMALLCRLSGLDELQVPMPACGQAFVDHDALVHKVYVIREKLFTSHRKSIPNMCALLAHPTAGSRVPNVVNFSSRKNLFASLFEGLKEDVSQTEGLPLDMSAVTAASEWMRKNLGINLFGFDVLVDSVTGDHVVVDVNYFPSFADVDSAASHVRTAIKGIIRDAVPQANGKHNLLIRVPEK